MLKFICPLLVFLFLFSGCKNKNIEKKYIRSAEQLIENSPEQAQKLLNMISEEHYFYLPPSWQARYTYLKCCLANQLDTDFPYTKDIETAKKWYLKQNKREEVIFLFLSLGRAYMGEGNNDKAMNVFLDGLEQAKKERFLNEAGYLNS